MSNDTNLSRLRSHKKWEQLEDAFFSTLRSYARLHEFSVVAAINNDEEAPRNYTLGPGSVSLDYKTDVERITEAALRNAPELQAAWFAMLGGGERVEPELARLVIRACAPLYLSAELPIYFRPRMKRRRGEPREKNEIV